MSSKEELSVIDCQTLNDITLDIKSFELTETKKNPLTVRIKFINNDKLKLGLPKESQKNPRYYVKLIDSKGNEWNKILEEK